MFFGKIRFLPIFLAGFCLFGRGASLRAAGVGTSAENFLKIAIGARPTAMGESFLAISDDSTALFWNPAGLSQLICPEFSMMHVAWFDDITYDYAGYSFPLYGQGLGLGVTVLNVSPFNSTLDPNAEQGSARDFSGTLAYSLPLTRHVLVGATAKTLYSSLASVNTLGAAVDAGLLYKPLGDSLTFAVVTQNLGFLGKFEQASDPLPLSFRMGVGYRLFNSRLDNLANFSVDMVKNLDNRFKYNVGAEAWLFNTIALRAGYKLSEGGQDFANQFSDFSTVGNLTAGFGLKISGADLDYAFVPYGELGFTHRFSASWKFGFEPRKVGTSQILATAPKFGNLPGGEQGVAFNTFSPKELTEIREWKAQIVDKDGEVIKTLAGRGQPPRNLAWDGTDEAGHMVDLNQPFRYNYMVRDLNGTAMAANGNVVQEIRPKDILLGGPKFSSDMGGLVFKPKADLAVGVKEWKLDIKTTDGKILKTITGTGAIPKSLVWDLKNKETGADLIASKGGISQVQYSLEFKDNAGKSKVVSDTVIFAAQRAEARVANIPMALKEFRVNPGKEILVCSIPNLTSANISEAEAVPFIMKVPTDKAVRNWRFEITSPDGHIVKTFKGLSPVPENIFWDGKDESGSLVASASSSRYSLWVTDAANKESKQTQREVVRQPFTIANQAGGIRRISGIWFQFLDSDLQPAVMDKLNEIAAALKKNPNMQVTIQGHSADEGSPEVSLRLSQERADTVLRYLIESEGVSPHNMSAIGFGNTMPIDKSKTQDAAARNRRVEVLMISRK